MARFLVFITIFFLLFSTYQNYKEEERILLTFPECNYANNFSGYGSIKACGYQKEKFFNIWRLRNFR